MKPVDRFAQNRTLDGRVMHHRVRQEVAYPLDSKSKCGCEACKGPKLQVIPQYGPRNGDCQFTKDGMCVTHMTPISEHASIQQTTTMTREEALARFPGARLP